ncbi:hypothetical protein, partial [Reichenbachiella sp. 5M10]|uniref:hypothetical protein n=1 Tax=Reichenbachiella sp. 5M10 TaxID=1889772 RepID=UPI001303F695
VGTDAGATTDNTSGYTFKVFRGQNTDIANEIEDGDPTSTGVGSVSISTTSVLAGNPGDDQITIVGVVAGTYTVEATDLDNKCTTTTEFTVTKDLSDIPVIDETALQAATSDNTQCGAPFDGEADATATVSGGSTNYSYAWYAGTNTTVAAIDTDILLNNVESGDYTLIVTDTDRGCVSAAVTVTVGETLDL